jgi:hypothetical protein
MSHELAIMSRILIAIALAAILAMPICSRSSKRKS